MRPLSPQQRSAVAALLVLGGLGLIAVWALGCSPISLIRCLERQG